MNIIASLLILVAVILSVLVFVTLVEWWRGFDNVLFPGLGVVAAMPAIIVLLLILNVLFVIAAAVVKPKKESVGETRNEQIFEYPDDIFSGCGNSTLTMFLAKNPNEYNADTDRGLKVCINYDDLESIYDIIAPSRVRYESYKEGEDYRKFEERNKKIFEEKNKEIFEQAVSKFPMLGRINNIYADYIFNPEEVKMLRQECLSVKKAKISAAGDLTLRKLIYACDEALKENFYLMFSGD